MQNATFSLKPGTIIQRALLHKQFGGSRQGDIAASQQSANIFLFVPKGSHHQWNSNKTALQFHGEGKTGDQEMKRGNKAILEHKSTKRALQVFESGSRVGVVWYVGEFELDGTKPYLEEIEFNSRTQESRKVFKFNLNKIK